MSEIGSVLPFPVDVNTGLNYKLLHSVWCNVTRISSGNCALRITKFDEKISLAFIKKENKKAGNNFHMKWNFFKNCLPGIMHLLELKKLQEAESILISWISIELEFFFSHSTWVSSLLESFQLIFQSTATAFVDWLFNYCSKTRHPNLWIAGYTSPDFDTSKSNEKSTTQKIIVNSILE